jgi:hypothetical protein
MAVKSALVSIGRRNSRPSGPHGRWFVSPRGGGHRPRPVEQHQEQARMVEHVNRSARDGVEHSPDGAYSASGAPESRPEARARPDFDLCVDVTKLALNIADRCVGGYLGLSQPHHLLRPLVPYSGAIERECVAVAAIGVGSVVAQRWQRSCQLSASLL